MFDYNKIFKPVHFESDYDENQFEVAPGIHVSYSKKNNAYFVNNVSIVNLDTWGMDQGIEQSAIMLSPEELDSYISILNEARSLSK